MKSLQNRRAFLSSLAAATAAGSIAPAHPLSAMEPIADPSEANRAQDDEHVVFHYEEPFDFGVMQGPQITDANFVGKNMDLPTGFFADQKRMRWALQHMSALQRTQRIARSGEPLRFNYRPLPLDGVKVRNAGGDQITVPQWLTLTQTDGFIAIYVSPKEGPVVATEQYWNGLKPETLHHLWSMSKSLAVGLVAIAMNRGKLQRSTRIDAVLPELAKCGLADATIDDVLNMASGVKNYIGPAWTFDGMVDFAMKGLFASSGFIEYHGMDPTVPQIGCMEFIATTEKASEHGVCFDYKDVDARTVVAAAERVLQGSFHELFTDLVWSKIGAEHDAYVCCDCYGRALTPFGFSATLRDCARWGLMHLPDTGRSVLPQDFVANLVNPHPTFSSPSSKRLDTVPEVTLKNGGYRDQYWVYPKGDGGAFTAGGWMGQQIHPPVAYFSPQALRKPLKC